MEPAGNRDGPSRSGPQRGNFVRRQRTAVREAGRGTQPSGQGEGLVDAPAAPLGTTHLHRIEISLSGGSRFSIPSAPCVPGPDCACAHGHGEAARQRNLYVSHATGTNVHMAAGSRTHAVLELCHSRADKLVVRIRWCTGHRTGTAPPPCSIVVTQTTGAARHEMAGLLKRTPGA